MKFFLMSLIEINAIAPIKNSSPGTPSSSGCSGKMDGVDTCPAPSCLSPKGKTPSQSLAEVRPGQVRGICSVEYLGWRQASMEANDELGDFYFFLFLADA